MRKMIFLMATFSLALSAFGQSAAVRVPTFELFGGYSFLHQSGNGEFEGWEASVSGNLNRWLALKADFSGHYAEEDFTPILFSPTTTLPPETIRQTFHQSIHYFLGGPEISYRRPKWKVFVHALVGADHTHQNITVHNPPPGLLVSGTGTTDTGFAIAIGGGGDWMFSKRIGWRVAQADYIRSRFAGDYTDNVRISSGLVFHF